MAEKKDPTFWQMTLLFTLVGLALIASAGCLVGVHVFLHKIGL